MTNVDLKNRHHKDGLQGIILHPQSLLTIYMSSENFEKVGYGLNLGFANQFVLFTCFILYEKWAS